MTIARDLQKIKLEIKALGSKMERLIAVVEKGGKPRAAKKSTAKTSVAAQAQKAPAKKKAAELTATDQVLKIINRSKKGVNAATLINKTGFDDKKIQNILHRTYKQGKITRVDKGVYAGA